jgi:hypothetical protein
VGVDTERRHRDDVTATVVVHDAARTHRLVGTVPGFDERRVPRQLPEPDAVVELAWLGML